MKEVLADIISSANPRKEFFREMLQILKASCQAGSGRKLHRPSCFGGVGLFPSPPSEGAGGNGGG